MKINLTKLIAIIQEDAPCVYDILCECSTIENPTPYELLFQLENYSGDNYDVHYWVGRYAEMHNPAIVSPFQNFYTVDKNNAIIESFGPLAEDVNPKEDYHEIRLDVYGRHVRTWTSMNDLCNVPF